MRKRFACLAFLFISFVPLRGWLPSSLASAQGASIAAESQARRVADGDVPLNLIETSDGALLSLNAGYGAQYLLAFDEARDQVRSRLEFKSLWYGLAFSPVRKLILASSGNDWINEIPWEDGKFGETKTISVPGCQVMAGVAWTSQTEAIVVCNLNHRAIKFDVRSGKLLATAETGEYPYGVTALPRGRAAVSNWGQSSITVFDTSNLRPLGTIRVGSHPNAMLLLQKYGQLLVACSDSDSISVIDLDELREARRVNLRIPGSTVGGAQPNALAFDPQNNRLYVALAGINALGVFALGEGDEDEMQFKGVIPVGPRPTALLYSGRHHALYIADGRNAVTGPSSPAAGVGVPGCRLLDKYDPLKFTYIGCLVGGAIEVLPDTALQDSGQKMISLATQVYGSATRPLSPDLSATVQRFSERGGQPGPIRHVIYIIKENRTYDTILGDMREGNGDQSLALFGEATTPNQHALASEFILFDNFYVDGDVSADGHLWSTAAESSDYINKLWPAQYSHRLKGFDIWGPDYNGDEKHDRPIAAPGSGFLWDAAQKAGISYRNYGERCETPDKDHPGHYLSFLYGLQGHYDPLYPPMGKDFGRTSDLERIAEFEREFREFEKNDNLPQLVIMHVPNDHTIGTRPGYLTPRAMVADNDLAVGRLVDLVSRSRFWASTAIFVLEDDAQDGPDHVDAHRSTLFVISPYTHLQKVEHAHFSTVSVLKTIEEILGLPSLTYFDDRAPSLLVDFESPPNLEPYSEVQPAVPIDEKNSPQAPGAKQSARWDFTKPDAAPEMELNRVIWKSVKGASSEPPAPIFDVQVRFHGSHPDPK